MIIYKTTNLINGKIYIGQDTKNDQNYLGSGKIIKEANKKYGKKNFTKEIIEICNNQDELNSREIYWIDKLESRNNEIGYNILSGGLGSTGFKQSVETIEKIKENNRSENFKKIMSSPEVSKKISEGQKNSDAKKNLHKSQEYREKMSKSLKNRIFSDDHRKKLSESLKGKKKSEIHSKNLSISLKNSEKIKGENNPFYGKKHSLETIEKIRETIKNKNNDNKK